jgi:hypothetical protein
LIGSKYKKNHCDDEKSGSVEKVSTDSTRAASVFAADISISHINTLVATATLKTSSVHADFASSITVEGGTIVRSWRATVTLFIVSSQTCVA